MSDFLGGYRLTVFAPRLIDFNEATVLTPIAGAPHADPFQVATIPGLVGWRPYLGLPEGSRGRVDPSTKKTSIGQMTFPILDVKVGQPTDNTQRWVTAFMGDVFGNMQLGGCKVFAEETLCGLVGGAGANGSFQAASTPPWTTGSEVPKKVDFYSATGTLVLSTVVTGNTATQLTFTGDATGAVLAITWAPFFTGRLAGDSLKGKITRQIVARDMAADLKGTLFVGIPHAQIWGTNARTDGAGGNGYVGRICQSPIGNFFPYGPFGAGSPLTGSIVQVLGSGRGGMLQVDAASVGAVRYGRACCVVTVAVAHVLTIDGPALYNASNGALITPFGIGLPVQSDGTPLPLGARVRVHIKDLTSGLEGDYLLSWLGMTANGQASRLTGVPRNAPYQITFRPLAGPLGVATGTPIANGAQTAGTVNVLTKGWTASVNQILRAGDVISFAGHLTRYAVTADVNSDGSGNATVPVVPMILGSGGLTQAIANNEAITVMASPNQQVTPPLNRSVSWYIMIDEPALPEDPLLLNDSHPVQWLQDMCRGYFGYLFQYGDQLPPGKNYGDPKRVIPYNAAVFATLLADTTFPTVRIPLTAVMKESDFTEQVVGQACELGYYFDGSGQFTPIDLRPPTSIAGLPIITDADLLETQPDPIWSHDPTAAVTLYQGTTYQEFFNDPTLVDFGTVGDIRAENAGSIVNEVGRTLLILTPGAVSVGLTDPLKVDFRVLRTYPPEAITVGSSSRSRSDWANAVAQKALNDLQPMLAYGPVTGAIACRRNANTSGLWQGALALLETTVTPDPSSLKRGGTRIIRILNRQEKGPALTFQIIDLGLTVVPTAPTLGTPAVNTDDPYHRATCAVTLGSGPAEVHVAVTPPGTLSAPADGDPGWMFETKLQNSGIVDADKLVPGQVIWFRARTLPNGPQLPSAWVHSTSVTLTALPSPTALSHSGLLATVVTLSWTVANPNLWVSLWIASPTTDPMQKLVLLDPGTTSFQIGVPPGTSPLVASTAYKVEVRHEDRTGGMSPPGATTDTFTTNTTTPTCPNMAALAVLSGV